MDPEDITELLANQGKKLSTFPFFVFEGFNLNEVSKFVQFDQELRLCSSDDFQ